MKSKELLKIFLPIYTSSVFATAYNIINVGIFAKHLDKASIAALGVSASLMFLLQGLALGLSSGFIAKISQKNTKSALPSAVITVVFSVMITALTLLFLPKIVTFLNADGEIFDYAQKYLRVSVSGFVILALYRLFESWLYALLKAKCVLWLSALMFVLQTLFTYLFVAVWDFGVTGGAFANVLSFFVCGAAALIYILKSQPSFFDFKQKFDLSLLKASLPLSFMQFFKGVGLVLIQMQVGALGTDASSAFAVCQKLSHLATDGAVALNSASLRTLSKQKPKIKRSVTVGVVFSLISGALLFFGSASLSALIFKSEDNILSLIKQYFYIISPFFPALLIMVVLRARLIVAGHPYLAMTEGIVELLVRVVFLFFIKDFARVPLAFGVSWTMGLVYLIAIKKRT